VNYTKQELLRQVNRFLKDRERGISIKLFCELCGLPETLIKEVFITQTKPMTERTQVRVNRAFNEWMSGNVRTMYSHAKGLHVEYRKQSKVPLMPHYGIKVTPDGIKMDIRMKNRHYYGDKTLDESLGG
jgi:hypothetical protein